MLVKIGGEKTVELLLFENVSNASTLKAQLLKGTYDAAFLNAHLIIDPFQVSVAANIAYSSFSSRTMKCRNINTQLVYNVSACRNISRSLSSFGITDDGTYILVVIMDPTKEKIAIVRENVLGDELCDVTDSLARKCDKDSVRHAYNIEEQELSASELLDSIVTRISCQQVL